MDIFQALILALIQGITEFLPISSSAHLILPSILLSWPDQGLAFDTTVHLGSLAAVVFYFRQDIKTLIIAAWQQWMTREPSDDAHLFWCLVVASLPIIPVGFVMRVFVEAELRDPIIIAAATIGFGVLLLYADFRKGSRDTHDITILSALGIGVAQCLALIPGTSRSGITMTMALLSGFSREAAAKISFLISIPAIGGAAFIKLVDLATTEVATGASALHLFIGFMVSGVSAYICIRLFLTTIARLSFLPFVIYRLLLGGLLLALFI